MVPGKASAEARADDFQPRPEKRLEDEQRGKTARDYFAEIDAEPVGLGQIAGLSPVVEPFL